LIKKEERIPTLYLSLEMSEEDVMDRLMSLKGDMPFISLRKGGAEARNSYRDHIKGAYQEISESKNFILADRSAVSVANMENIVMEAKEKFHSNGVLREDGYVMVIIDLLTMLTDFKDFSPNLIQQTMDQLLYVAKRQKVHLLGVVQSNENWLRERPLKSLKDVDNFQLSRSSVKGGAGIFERARVVLSVLRRKQLKKEFLPHLEEDWEDDDDILELHCIKDSHGFPFRLNYLFGQNFRIMPFAGPVPGPKTDEGED
jgi:replicative DNA helicase